MYFLFQSIISLFLGGLIYIIYRTEDLLMFRWFEFLKLNFLVDELQLLSHYNLPDWFVFSLPDALWIYSFSMAMLYIWDGELNKKSFLWILVAPILGIFGEIAQIFGLEGTFDLMDLLLCIVASLLIFVQIKKFDLKFYFKN